MIVVLDFGSQYNQLIARRVRENEVPVEILPFDAPLERIRALEPKGLILSGGPASVHEEGAPRLNPELLELEVPILGICYGMQALARAEQGNVEPGAHGGEYGLAHLQVTAAADPLLQGISDEENPQTSVWMSHRDAVAALPEGWINLAKTEGCPNAIMRHSEHPWWGLQFHPEVHHTQAGPVILRAFARDICGCAPTWKMDDWIERKIEELRTEVGDRHVVAAVSGGVDSTVMAVLLNRALGDQLRCFYIDNGLMRLHESDEVMEMFDGLGLKVQRIDAGQQFLEPLAGVDEPEEKRRIIGRVFIEVLKEQFQKAEEADAKDGEKGGDLLAQGTLYPDVIESVSTRGPSATIKTHHNRVAEVLGLMEEGRIVEPLRELFKDEVREVGRLLGIPREALWRHPFPGPGLAIRILGAVDEPQLEKLRRADRIVTDELKEAGLYFDYTWQAFAVLLPVRSVGVMGDERTYDNVIAVRCVSATDGMTADWSDLPREVLGRMANRIVNEVAGINRVVYDITSKPPGTIEWE